MLGSIKYSDSATLLHWPITALVLVLTGLMLCARTAWADADAVEVVEPYIEYHTGPGRGYPIFHIVERGEWINIIQRQLNWFQVLGNDGKKGWVDLNQLNLTRRTNGELTHFPAVTIESFTRHDLEIGTLGGDFENYQAMTLYGSYALTPNLSIKLATSKLFSDFASGFIITAGITIHPYPDARLSPFFGLGTGIIRRNPHTTLTQEPDHSDQLAQMQAGLRIYLAQRFIFRVQYSKYVIFQGQTPGRLDDNQEIDEWKAGFAVFF